CSPPSGPCAKRQENPERSTSPAGPAWGIVPRRTVSGPGLLKTVYSVRGSDGRNSCSTSPPASLSSSATRQRPPAPSRTCRGPRPPPPGARKRQGARRPPPPPPPPPRQDVRQPPHAAAHQRARHAPLRPRQDAPGQHLPRRRRHVHHQRPNVRRRQFHDRPQA